MYQRIKVKFGDAASAAQIQAAQTVIVEEFNNIVRCPDFHCIYVPKTLHDQGIGLKAMQIISCRSCSGCLRRAHWMKRRREEKAKENKSEK